MTGLLRRRPAWAALAPLLATATLPAFLAAAASPSGAAGEDRPVALTIAFTGDVGGYLEPCG